MNIDFIHDPTNNVFQAASPYCAIVKIRTLISMEKTTNNASR